MNEVQIIIVPNLFCGPLFKPNLFCGPLGMHVILLPSFQTKFILRFDFLSITVRHEIGKRYNGLNLIDARAHSQKKGYYQFRLSTTAE